MKGIISIILGVGFIGIVVLLCLFSCVVASRDDEYWDEVKKEMRKSDERH